MMRSHITMASIVAAVCLFVGPSIFAEGLPREAQKLVDAFQKKVTVTRLKLATDQKKAINTTIEALRAVQKKYTTEEKLDEAIAVRNYVRELEAARKEGTYTAPDADELAELPEDAQKIILDQEPLDDEDAALEKALAEDRETLINKLTEMQGTFTKSERLDEALAIKEYLDGGVPLEDAPAVDDAPKTRRKSTKIDIPNITKGTTSYEQVNHNFQQQRAAWQRQLQEAERITLDGLSKKLTQLQAVHSRADRLENAVNIKSLVATIDTEKNTPAAMNMVRALSPKLPDDAKAACEKALRAEDKLRADIAEGERQLQEQLVKPMEARAIQLLKEGKLEESRVMLGSLCVVRQPPVHFPHLYPGRHNGPTPYSEDVVELIDAFNEASRERTEAADARDSEQRAELLTALKGLPQNESIDRTIDLLESDGAAGIRGMVLFQRDPNLPEEAANLVRGYRSQTRDSIAQLKTDMETAEKEFRQTLAAIRLKQVEQGELVTAFCTLLAESESHYVFEPIPVKYTTVEGWDPNSDGKVLDAKDGFCLILEWHGRTAWVPRHQVVAGNEIATPKPAATPGTPPPPPGRPITSKTKLKKGQRLMYKDFHGWKPVEVISLTPGGAEIGFLDQRGPGFNKTATREELRDISED